MYLLCKYVISGEPVFNLGGAHRLPASAGTLLQIDSSLTPTNDAQCLGNLSFCYSAEAQLSSKKFHCCKPSQN